MDTLTHPIGTFVNCFPTPLPLQTVSCGAQTWDVAQIIQFEATTMPVTIQMTPTSLPPPIQGLLLDDCGDVIWNTDETCLTVEPFNEAGLSTQWFYTLDFQLDPGTYYWATYVPPGEFTGCYLVLIGTFGFLSLPPDLVEEPDMIPDTPVISDGKYFQEGFGLFIVHRGIKYNMYGMEIQ